MGKRFIGAEESNLHVIHEVTRKDLLSTNSHE
jgi:hypothetical protein